MEENKLLEQKELRQKLIERTEVLDKVKELILLPYGDSMTTEMVADYYEVGISAIKSLVFDNENEITSNGYKTLEKEELSSFKELCQIKSRAKSLAIFTRRTILNVGMLLRDSEVAKEVRTKLLDMSESKEVIDNAVTDIDQEQLLMLKIMSAKDDMEQMVAINALKRYRDEKENKITKERDVAVKKVQDLGKSDATWGVREAKTNLGVKEKQFTNWMIHNKFIYRQHKNGDEKGKPSGRIKANSQYTKEPTRYFTDINQIDRLGNPHTQTVITVDGLEYFRTRIEDINCFKQLIN